MKKHSPFRFRICALILFLFACAFLLPASRTGNTELYLLAAAVPGAMLFLLLFPAGHLAPDRPVLAAALSLCGFGILAPVYLSPDDAVSQGFRCAAGLVFLFFGIVLLKAFRPSVPAAVLSVLCGLALFTLPGWFPSVPFSLSEGGMALVLLSVAAFLSLRLRLPALLAGLCGVLLLLLHKEIDSAVILAVSAVLVFWASSGSALWSGISLVSAGTLVAAFFVISPQPVSSPSQALLTRLAAMPLLPPEAVPAPAAVSEPLVFLLGEQFGLVFLLCAVLLLPLLLLRGASLALNARKSFHASLALGIILLFGLRTLLFLGSASGLLPFSPGAFPFLSSSMPDLFADFFLLGLLSGVSSQNEKDLEEDTRLAMLAR